MNDLSISDDCAIHQIQHICLPQLIFEKKTLEKKNRRDVFDYHEP